jgi:hypothetical protein
LIFKKKKPLVEGIWKKLNIKESLIPLFQKPQKTTSFMKKPNGLAPVI